MQSACSLRHRDRRYTAADPYLIELPVHIKQMRAYSKAGAETYFKLTTDIDMASINPARNLGVDKEMGSIALGKKANVTVLDKEYNVVMTIRDGVVVYNK